MQAGAKKGCCGVGVGVGVGAVVTTHSGPLRPTDRSPHRSLCVAHTFTHPCCCRRRRAGWRRWRWRAARGPRPGRACGSWFDGLGLWLVACWKAWSSLKKPLRVLWEGGGKRSGGRVRTTSWIGFARANRQRDSRRHPHTPSHPRLGVSRGGGQGSVCGQMVPQNAAIWRAYGGALRRARFVSAADGLAFCSKLKAGRQAAAPPTSDRINTDSRRPTLLSAPPSLDKATAKHEEGKNKAGQ